MKDDVDSTFTALREHIDGVLEMPAAATIRRRGERWARRRATTAAALCVVLAGVGVAVGHDRLDRRGPKVPSAPRPQVSELSLVGSAIDLPDVAGPVHVVSTESLAVAAWTGSGGTTHIIGVDPRTGQEAWPMRTLTGRGSLGAADVVDGAVLLTMGRQPGRLVELDPADGYSSWQILSEQEDYRIHLRDRLIVMSASTGVTRAVDWPTGHVLWEVPAGSDPPVRMRAVPSGPDPQLSGWPTPDTSSGERFLQLTESGKVLVRDSRTGAVQRTVSNLGTAEGLVVAGDHLYTPEQGSDSYRIRQASLTGPDASSVVYTAPPGRSFLGAAPCGDNRLCVIDEAPEAPPHTELTAIDVATSRELWRVPAPPGAESPGSRGDRVLVNGDDGAGGVTSALYDSTGRQLLDEPDRRSMLLWNSNDTVVSLPGLHGPPQPGKAKGHVTVISAADGKAVIEGMAGDAPLTCAVTAKRLICEDGHRLEVRSLEP
ncbi:PQQ-binding-like beta-propeller repeat protein [Actinoplanes sp. NPDC089786]|uniref:outer membrane protein assembly factor BamB family protein n=1 Tax=Actinoplanes sp. NPDC089786 TaxID=3155185 RepID=UPI00344263FA